VTQTSGGLVCDGCRGGGGGGGFFLAIEAEKLDNGVVEGGVVEYGVCDCDAECADVVDGRRSREK
jgi:hypothetical protein